MPNRLPLLRTLYVWWPTQSGSLKSLHVHQDCLLWNVNFMTRSLNQIACYCLWSTDQDDWFSLTAIRQNIPSASIGKKMEVPSGKSPSATGKWVGENALTDLQFQPRWIGQKKKRRIGFLLIHLENGIRTSLAVIGEPGSDVGQHHRSCTDAECWSENGNTRSVCCTIGLVSSPLNYWPMSVWWAVVSC